MQAQSVTQHGKTGRLSGMSEVSVALVFATIPHFTATRDYGAQLYLVTMPIYVPQWTSRQLQTGD